MGQLGRVHLISQSGSLVLRVNGRQWLMDSSCVVPAPGEHPEDELSKVIWVNRIIQYYICLCDSFRHILANHLSIQHFLVCHPANPLNMAWE